ncbi:MAG: MobF family relaxase, partial [Candidatus Acidiferrales bacterium]
KLDADGRMHEISDTDERIATIAHEYKKQPEGTLVVSPDNKSREAINETIHYAMQDTYQMPYVEYQMRVLVARQEITGADRQWAAQYEPGNVVRYAKGSKTLGIKP